MLGSNLGIDRFRFVVEASRPMEFELVIPDVDLEA